MSDTKKKDPITRTIDAFVTGIIILIAACIGLTLLVKFLGFIVVGLALVVATWLSMRFYRQAAQERRDHAEYRRNHP